MGKGEKSWCCFWSQKECCSGPRKNEISRTKHPPNGCNSHSRLQVLNCCMFCFFYFFLLWSRGFVGGACWCLYHNSLTAGGSHHVMFLTDVLLLLLLLLSTGLISPPSTSSCVLKEMEILFTQSTNTHICSLMLHFVDMRRLVGRLVSSDRL